MRIVIATVQVPFIRGGAEILAEGLRTALRTAGHEAEIVAIPFQWDPPERILDHMLACRFLDLTHVCRVPVDRVIGLKFPAYLVPHPNKALWVLHQHRQAYDLWDHPACGLINSPIGAQVRHAIQEGDRRLLPEARSVFTISENVTRRMREHCGVASTPLYHPPFGAERLYCAPDEGYFYFPSRISALKRQTLVLEAMALMRHSTRVRFAGAADTPAYGEELRSMADKLKVQQRVDWLGQVTDDDMRGLYAHARAVVFPPADEDYGYVTLEAMLSAKPVITCSDSGGPLEFVVQERTGLVAEPTPAALAAAMDALAAAPEQARSMGAAARARYDELGISWSKIVESLVA